MGNLLAFAVVLALSLVIALTAARAALALVFYLIMRPTPLFQFPQASRARHHIPPSEALAAGALTR
jgi:hypothetical protein